MGHYLPVMAVFRPNDKSESLGTHFYPKMEVKDGKFSCWITFLGAHGHCEAHSSKYDLYNSDDTPEGYSKGSGTSAEDCLSRADWWMKYCDTPVLATVSSSVLQHGGVNTSSSSSSSGMENKAYGYQEKKYQENKYEEAKPEAPKYEETKYEEKKYEEPKYEEKKYEEPKYEAPKYEEPKYEEPKYEQ